MAKCIVAGCSNTTAGESGVGRGMCRAHYKRWYKYGNVDEPVRRVHSWKGEICAVIGCEKPVRRNGLCDTHAAAQKRLERPDGIRAATAKARDKRLAQREALMGRPKPQWCEICGSAGYGRAGHKNAGICFDHDHLTGKPRGWLCDRCNKVLGLVKDSVELLTKLSKYLEKSNGEVEREGEEIAA